MDDVTHLSQAGLVVRHVDVVGSELPSQFVEIRDYHLLRGYGNRKSRDRFGPIFVADIYQQDKVKGIPLFLKNGFGGGDSQVQRWNWHIGVCPHNTSKISDINPADLMGFVMLEMFNMKNPARP